VGTWALIVITALGGCASDKFGQPPDKTADPRTVLRQPNRLELGEPGEYQARLGQPIVYRYAYRAVPQSIYNLKVAIDGVSVPDPEILPCDTSPGYADNAYVFRPTQAGTYQLELIRHYLNGQEVPMRYTIDVK
jgi:hypothetical protein